MKTKIKLWLESFLFKENKIKFDELKKDYQEEIRRNRELSNILDTALNGWREVTYIHLPEWCHWGYHYGSLSEKEVRKIEKKDPDRFKALLEDIALGSLLSGCKNKREKLKVLKKWKKDHEEREDID